MELWPTFVEGIGHMALPCAVGLLLPGVAVLLLAGKHPLLAAAGFTAAAGVFAWRRAAGVDLALSSQLLALIALGAVALFLLARENWATSLAGAAGAGLVAGATWVPCVGEQLGRILTEAPADPGAALLPMLVYVIGVCGLLLVIGLVPIVQPKTQRWFEARVTTALGGLIAMLLVAALAAGLYGDILSELAQLSA